jgi:hypothetical protein
MDHNGYSVGCGALQGIEGADLRKRSTGFMLVVGFRGAVLGRPVGPEERLRIFI